MSLHYLVKSKMIIEHLL